MSADPTFEQALAAWRAGKLSADEMRAAVTAANLHAQWIDAEPPQLSKEDNAALYGEPPAPLSEETKAFLRKWEDWKRANQFNIDNGLPPLPEPKREEPMHIPARQEPTKSPFASRHSPGEKAPSRQLNTTYTGLIKKIFCDPDDNGAPRLNLWVQFPNGKEEYLNFQGVYPDGFAALSDDYQIKLVERDWYWGKAKLDYKRDYPVTDLPITWHYVYKQGTAKLRPVADPQPREPEMISEADAQANPPEPKRVRDIDDHWEANWWYQIDTRTKQVIDREFEKMADVPNTPGLKAVTGNQLLRQYKNYTVVGMDVLSLAKPAEPKSEDDAMRRDIDDWFPAKTQPEPPAAPAKPKAPEDTYYLGHIATPSKLQFVIPNHVKRVHHLEDGEALFEELHRIFGEPFYEALKHLSPEQVWDKVLRDDFYYMEQEIKALLVTYSYDYRIGSDLWGWLAVVTGFLTPTKTLEVLGVLGTLNKVEQYLIQHSQDAPKSGQQTADVKEKGKTPVTNTNAPAATKSDWIAAIAAFRRKYSDYDISDEWLCQTLKVVKLSEWHKPLEAAIALWETGMKVSPVDDSFPINELEASYADEAPATLPSNHAESPVVVFPQSNGETLYNGRAYSVTIRVGGTAEQAIAILNEYDRLAKMPGIEMRSNHNAAQPTGYQQQAAAPAQPGKVSCMLIKIEKAYSSDKPQLQFECEGMDKPLNYSKSPADMVKLLSGIRKANGQAFTESDIAIGKKYGVDCLVSWSLSAPNEQGKQYRNVTAVSAA